MLIALLGPDRYSVSQALHGYLAKYAPDTDALGDLNLTRLDGARTSPDELARAVQAMGFLAETRVVVVEGLMSRFGAGKSADAGEDGTNDRKGRSAHKGTRQGRSRATDGFAGVLGSVPDTTVLLLVERGGVAAKNNSLLKVATRYGKVEEYIPPKGVALERWISNYASRAEVKITPGAQGALAAAMPDLQMLANEIDKLALFTGHAGTIDERVLRDMSYASRQEDVFELTNALALRDTKGALKQMQRLRESGTAVEGVLPVLAWQVRTLSRCAICSTAKCRTATWLRRLVSAIS